MQCFDAAGTKLEFKPLETFGFLPVPETLKEAAISEVEVSSMQHTAYTMLHTSGRS